MISTRSAQQPCFVAPVTILTYSEDCLLTTANNAKESFKETRFKYSRKRTRRAPKH